MLIGNLQRAVYVIAVALAVAVVALVLAISALSRRRSGPGPRRPRGAVAGVVLGVDRRRCSAAFALIGFLIFWSQSCSTRNCMNGASTDRHAERLPAAVRQLVGTEITVLGRYRCQPGLTRGSSAHGLTWMRWPPASSVSSTMSAGTGPLTRASGAAGAGVRGRSSAGASPGPTAAAAQAADVVPDDQPVGRARDQGGRHPDLEHGDQADLAAGRADRGEPSRAERTAGELRAEPDDHRGRASR